MEDVTAEALREAVTALGRTPKSPQGARRSSRTWPRKGGTHQAADIIELALPAWTA